MRQRLGFSGFSYLSNTEDAACNIGAGGYERKHSINQLLHLTPCE